MALDQKVLRQRHLLGRPAFAGLFPGGVSAPVAALVAGRAADREDRQDVRMPVDELASHLGRHACQLAVDELVRLALDVQRQRALEDDVHLLLVQVAVDPAALAGPQQQQVQPERADAQLGAQPLEALVVLEVDAGERDTALHGADYGRLSRGLPRRRSVENRVDPFTGSVDCPVTVHFSGRISVSRGSGTVSYRWVRSDGARGPVESLAFTGPGSQTVQTTWTLGAPGAALRHSERIDILEPADSPDSEDAAFDLTCNA
jgi:hypothetical protein